MDIKTMSAFTRDVYGGPEALKLDFVDKPVLKDDQVLVRVYANSANPVDWHILRGEPFFARLTFGLFKPKDKIIGADFAGVVVEEGKNARKFKVGDKVFGETLKGGSFAEYVAAPEDACASMPAEIGFSEMASLPVAGLTAFQALTTHGKLKCGETVLINGASGGVGHFAVQIAKAYGAHVTAVCSSRNESFVKSLGADIVIAYDRENIHQHKGKYDLVIDTNGNLFYNDYVRMGNRGVIIGFTSMRHLVQMMFRKSLGKFPLAQFTAEANTEDLRALASLVSDNKIKPHIEKTYSYKDTPAAISFLEAMRTRGKVVIIWKPESRVTGQ